MNFAGIADSTSNVYCISNNGKLHSIFTSYIADYASPVWIKSIPLKDLAGQKVQNRPSAQRLQITRIHLGSFFISQRPYMPKWVTG